MGHDKGFINRVRVQNPLTHCFLHREERVAKKLPKELSDVLNRMTDIVNFVNDAAIKHLSLLDFT